MNTGTTIIFVKLTINIATIGVGDGRGIVGARDPHQKNLGKNIFHVKFGHFVNFSYMYFID